MSHIRSVRWGVPVRETLVLSHRLCEVGWPVPFLAAFISPVFPPGTHLLLGGQWVIKQWLYVGLEPWFSHQVASALTAKLLAHFINNNKEINDKKHIIKKQ